MPSYSIPILFARKVGLEFPDVLARTAVLGVQARWHLHFERNQSSRARQVRASARSRKMLSGKLLLSDVTQPYRFKLRYKEKRKKWAKKKGKEEKGGEMF